MRTDSIKFALADRTASRRPRYVIRIGYPTASVFCTSHDDISNVPGVPIENVLKEPSAISQRLVPDEGRSEIGSFSFSIVDIEGAFSDVIKTHLADGEGLRGREVKFFVGYEGFDFTEFQLFTTQIVVSDDCKDGVYSIQCQDITREQNKEIFKPVATTLRQSITADATTIPVGDTTDFEAVYHGDAYSDAPNAIVYYFRLEDEIIRATSKDASNFINCSRGVLNTVARAHSISDNTSQDRQPKVEEYIYLEGPGPQLALAVLTGEIYGTVYTLPDHWNLQNDPVYVRESDFTNIGLDLWNPADETDSLVLRFEGLKAQDGKRFIEKEICLLVGCFTRVYADGTLGLKRMAPLITSAGPSFALNESVITDLGSLKHDGESMHNQFRILWAWDSLVEDYIRESRFIDAFSIEVHGKSPLLTYEFRGLHGERHTDITIAQRLASIRDRYSTPPERIQVKAFGSLNRIEVGDVGKITLAAESIRDYAELESFDFDRSYEVHQQTYDAASGEITLDLFGSTIRPQPLPPVSSDFHALADTWYTSEGAALSTAVTIVGNVVQPGTYTITGNASLRASGAVFYHDADLTIADGAIIQIANNVQIRIRGFLTNNGDITGVGGGMPGVVDAGGAITSPIPGNAGFFGNSRGWDGVDNDRIIRSIVHLNSTIPALVRGTVDAIPVFELRADGGVLGGLPNDLRGSGGAPGGRLHTVNLGTFAGGAGANGGAGLAIICRGLAFGASGSITLDGQNSAATTSQELTVGPNGHRVYPGSGGGGAPGAMLVLLDGSSITFPLISGKFFARGGSVPQPGFPMPARDMTLGDSRFLGNPNVIGYADPDAVALSGHDYSTSAYGIQYIGEAVDAEPDQNPRPPAPTALRASSSAGGNLLTWIPPSSDSYTVIEVYSSISNNRTDATFAGEVKGSSFQHSLPLGERRYYWIRSSRTYADARVAMRSTWEPVSETAGIVSNAETPSETPDAPADFWAVGQVNGIRFSWALPSVGRLLGKVRLFEHTSPTPFEDATLVWEGYGFSYTLPRDALDTRYYWLELFRGGEFSDASGEGLPAAATSVTPVLSVIVTPQSASLNAGQASSGPKTITTAPFITSVSGGVPPYTYSWAVTAYSGNLVYDPSDIAINSPSSASTTISGTGTFSGAKKRVDVRVTATDALGFGATADVVVNFYWPKPRVIF